PERTLAVFWSVLFAAEGNRAEALKILSSLNPGPGTACPVAAVYASLGDQSQVMSWLDRIIETRAGCFTMIPADPLYSRWHGTPEFQALLRKMKLTTTH